MQVVYLYNIVIVWLHYSCLTADRLQAPSPLLPLLPYLVRLIRDPRCSFFGTSEKLKFCKPLPMWEFSSQPSPLTTIKAKASCPSLLSRIIFRPAEELSCYSQGILYVSNKPLHSVVWHHQFWHLNLTLQSGASSHLCGWL